MSRFAIRSHLAALAMAAASSGLLTGSVMAAAFAGGGSAVMREGLRGDSNTADDGLWVPGLGPVSKAQLDTLKLDGAQQALVKTVRDGRRRIRDAMRVSVVQRHGLIKAQLDSGKLNPRAWFEQSDHDSKQLDLLNRLLRGQWLALWDSLNDAQRRQLIQIIKTRLTKAKDRLAQGKYRHHRGVGQAQDAALVHRGKAFVNLGLL